MKISTLAIICLISAAAGACYTMHTYTVTQSASSSQFELPDAGDTSDAGGQ